MKNTMLNKVRAYLAHRRSLGFRLRSEGRTLLAFARYADGLAHRGALTRKLAIRWACLPKSADRLSAGPGGWKSFARLPNTFA